MKITDLRRILCSILIFNLLSASALAQPGLGLPRIITIRTPSGPVFIVRPEIPQIEQKSVLNLFDNPLGNRGSQSQRSRILLPPPRVSPNPPLLSSLECELLPSLSVPLSILNAPLLPANLIQKQRTIPTRQTTPPRRK
ncbi:MAG TPA: hypothetical protein VF599_09195 [Pyrinomonadaceae bacterium]